MKKEDLIEALQYGKTLELPDLWARRAQLTSLCVIALNAGLVVLKVAGINLTVDEADVTALAAALAMVLAAVSHVLHVVSNPNAHTSLFGDHKRSE